MPQCRARGVINRRRCIFAEGEQISLVEAEHAGNTVIHKAPQQSPQPPGRISANGLASVVHQQGAVKKHAKQLKTGASATSSQNVEALLGRSKDNAVCGPPAMHFCLAVL